MIGEMVLKILLLNLFFNLFFSLKKFKDNIICNFQSWINFLKFVIKYFSILKYNIDINNFENHK